METKQLLKTVIAAAVLAIASLPAAAQQQTQETFAPQKQQSKSTAAKSAKVWTDDDVSSLRSPADAYVTEKNAEAAAAAQQAAAAKQAAANPAHHDSPPRLSNPKTAEDADKMIDWENRDIAAQQQYIERLKNQIETAAPGQKEHLQETLQKEIQIVADTQKERNGLVAQKQALEKKPDAGSNKATAPPQSQ